MSASLEFPHKHPISAEEYLRMDEAGVFAPEARLELIDGEIIEMAPINAPHSGRVNRLMRLLFQRVGDRAVLSPQNALVISERSVPQPDIALLRPREDDYMDALPCVADVLLVIEVADSTARFDLRTKAPLYARCGIPETWVVDVNARVIHVFRDPRADGYATSFQVEPGAGVACAALAEARIEAAELFPG